jgi:hypothetical protein
MNPIKAVISLAALVLVAFLVTGFILPGEWSARATLELDSPPDRVFPWVNELAGWDAWAGFDAVEDSLSGPAAGVGATRRWDDPRWGQGEWRLTVSDPPSGVAYRVLVEDGSMSTTGEIRLSPVAGGRTALVWTEEGDFGWNPLLSWFALGMPRMQREEMEKSLARLDSLVREEARAGR